MAARRMSILQMNPEPGRSGRPGGGPAGGAGGRWISRRRIALTHRGEAERPPGASTGDLRRIAALALLVGVLGSLLASGVFWPRSPRPGPLHRAPVIFGSASTAWGPALAEQYAP